MELVGDVAPAGSVDGSDLTAGIVLDDGPLPGAAADGRLASWQRVATGFLLGYDGASRAAYAADLCDYLSWWTDITVLEAVDGNGAVAGHDGHGLDPLTARRANVDAYASALREAGASPATISRRLATLSGFYGYAVDDQLIERSPTTRVRRPKIGEHAVSTGLSRDELTALVATA